jgi:hypothetical protein
MIRVIGMVPDRAGRAEISYFSLFFRIIFFPPEILHQPEFMDRLRTFHINDLFPIG